MDKFADWECNSCLDEGEKTAANEDRAALMDLGGIVDADNPDLEKLKRVIRVLNKMGHCNGSRTRHKKAT